MLTRPSGQLVALALATWILWRLGWRRSLSYTACLVLVVSPWIVRNWVRLGSPVLVTSNGFNLHAMYSPEAKARRGFVDAVFDPRLAHLRAGVRDEVELDAVLRRRGLQSLSEDPGYVLQVLRRNVVSMFELQPHRNRVAERVDGRNLQVRTASLPLVWLVLAAGLAGTWVLRRHPGIGPLVVAGVAFCAASLLTVTAPRLRAPIDLVCCIAAAGAFAEAVGRRAGPSGMAPVAPAGGAATAAPGAG